MRPDVLGSVPDLLLLQLELLIQPLETLTEAVHFLLREPADLCEGFERLEIQRAGLRIPRLP